MHFQAILLLGIKAGTLLQLPCRTAEAPPQVRHFFFRRSNVRPRAGAASTIKKSMTTTAATPSTKQRRIVRLLALVGILVLIGFLVLPRLGLFGDEDSASGANAAGGGRGGRGPQGPARVMGYVVQSGTLGAPVILAGTILPNERVEITSEVAGKVTDIGFGEGRSVAAGTVLARLNDSELRASLEKAKSRQRLAQLDQQRKKALLDREAISPAEYEVAVNELQVAGADIALLEAQLAKMEIRAPFSGVIGLRQISLGSYVTPSTVIATLQDVDPLKVEFLVPERYAASMQSGMVFTYTVEGSSSPRSARVYAVEPALDERTRALRVRALSSNPGGNIMPGQYAGVELKTGATNAVPLIPTSAIVPTMNGQQVFLIREGKAVAQGVKTGARSGQMIEVVEGLNSGDTVIVSGLQGLEDGSPVAPSFE